MASSVRTDSETLLICVMVWPGGKLSSISIAFWVHVRDQRRLWPATWLVMFLIECFHKGLPPFSSSGLLSRVRWMPWCLLGRTEGGQNIKILRELTVLLGVSQGPFESPLSLVFINRGYSGTKEGGSFLQGFMHLSLAFFIFTLLDSLSRSVYDIFPLTVCL